MRAILALTSAVAVLIGPLAAEGWADSAIDILRASAPEPLLTYGTIERVTSIFPGDVLDIEISSDGITTEALLRLQDAAADDLLAITETAIGFDIALNVCAHTVRDTRVEAVNDTGTLYIPDLTSQQAEAMRALWHGRQTCADLPPEVFPLGQ